MGLKDNSKQWFQKFDKPTEQQFATTFDNLRWKDENIPQNEIEDLETTLNGKADAATVQTLTDILFPFIHNYALDFTNVKAAGREIEKVRFKPSVNIFLKVGLTNGGNELWEGDVEYEANQWHLIHLEYFDEAAATVYFGGVTADTKFYIYKR